MKIEEARRLEALRLATGIAPSLGLSDAKAIVLAAEKFAEFLTPKGAARGRP